MKTGLLVATLLLLAAPAFPCDWTDDRCWNGQDENALLSIRAAREFDQWKGEMLEERVRRLEGEQPRETPPLPESARIEIERRGAATSELCKAYQMDVRAGRRPPWNPCAENGAERAATRSLTEDERELRDWLAVHGR